MTSKLKQVAVAALVAMSGAAFALPSVTTAFVPGVMNTLSDDFVEILIDNDASGDLSVGDFLATSLAMTSYAPSGTNAATVNELSVFSAVAITSRIGLPTAACLTAVLPGGCAAFEFGSVGAATFSALYTFFGGGALALPVGADTVAVFLEDGTPDFTTAAFASGLDGAARMVVDLVAANGDSWQAVGPISPAGFLANPVGFGIGSFSIDATISAQDFAGWDMGTQMTARGNLSRAPVDAASPLGGDASFFLTPNRVPEPAGLGLAALALLGMGAASARRRKA